MDHLALLFDRGLVLGGGRVPVVGDDHLVVVVGRVQLHCVAPSRSHVLKSTEQASHVSARNHTRTIPRGCEWRRGKFVTPKARCNASRNAENPHALQSFAWQSSPNLIL